MKCLNVSAPSVSLDTVASSFMSVLFVLSILSVLYLVIIVFCGSVCSVIALKKIKQSRLSNNCFLVSRARRAEARPYSAQCSGSRQVESLDNVFAEQKESPHHNTSLPADQ